MVEREHYIVDESINWVLEALESWLIHHDVHFYTFRKGLGPRSGISCDVESHVVDHDNNQVNVALNTPMRLTLIH